MKKPIIKSKNFYLDNLMFEKRYTDISLAIPAGYKVKKVKVEKDIVKIHLIEK